MNEVNLNAFQFEYDVTWMSFFQNAEGRTYARYGGRDDTDAGSHMTQKSLVKTMQTVLELHENNGVKPWSKYEPEPKEVFTPEQIPPTKIMLSKRKEKCIHCHDVKVAMLHDRFNKNELSKYDIYTYPSPARVGIELDADEQSQVKAVIPDSPAAQAGVKRGDTIATADGQRILTFADFTRVLELAPETGTLKLQVQRTGTAADLNLKLSKGWRKSPDPSWRESTGAVGPNSGFWANPLNGKERRQRNLDSNDLALRVVVVWGAWAKQAGVKNGDVVVEFDGIATKKTIRQLQTHLQLNHDYGDTVTVKVLRGGKVKELTMTLPKNREIH